MKKTQKRFVCIFGYKNKKDLGFIICEGYTDLNLKSLKDYYKTKYPNLFKIQICEDLKQKPNFKNIIN